MGPTPSISRDVVIMRGNGHSPRSVRVRVDAWDSNQRALTVTLKVFSGLPNEEPDRTKTSTIYRDECAQIAPAGGYGRFTVCNDCRPSEPNDRRLSDSPFEEQESGLQAGTFY